MRASFIFSLRLALASNDVSCRLQTCAYELNNTAAFVYRQAVGSFLGRRRRTLELLAEEAASRVERAMRAALADGLAWNSLGMSFPSSWNFASNAMPSLVQYYLGVGEANRAMFRVDHENCSRFLPDNDMAAGLRRDGHFLVDDWGLSSAQLELLTNTTRYILATRGHLSAKGGVESYVGRDIPHLALWLDNPTLRAALKAHLGGAYVMTRAAILRLTNRLSSESGYASALWHHDRCGRRVKAFLFLHDVSADGRPTWIANASHDTIYYTYDESTQLSRFATSWVSANYRTVPALGRKGGGFVFDTNTVHRGQPDGARPRTVWLADFILAEKQSALRKINFFRYRSPCLERK